jgi:hypothetical protein
MPVSQSPAHYINSTKGSPSITESFPLVVFLVLCATVAALPVVQPHFPFLPFSRKILFLDFDRTFRYFTFILLKGLLARAKSKAQFLSRAALILCQIATKIPRKEPRTKVCNPKLTSLWGFIAAKSCRNYGDGVPFSAPQLITALDCSAGLPAKLSSHWFF